MSRGVVYVGKCSNPTGGKGNKWHVFRQKDSKYSACGSVKRSMLSQNSSMRKWDTRKESFDEVSGLGDNCRSCREYINGSLSDITVEGKGSEQNQGNWLDAINESNVND